MIVYILVAALILQLAYFLFFKIRWGKLPKLEGLYAQIDGINVYYKKTGHGNIPLLLIHGIAANTFCWRKLTPVLAQKYSVYEIDLPGFGYSDKPFDFKRYQLKNQAENIHKFIQTVIKKPTILVGNSMGGSISLEASLINTESVKALILLNPAYDAKIVTADFSILRHFYFLFTFLLTPLTARFFINRLYNLKKDVTENVVKGYIQPFLINVNASFYSLFSSVKCLKDEELKIRISNIQKPTFIIWGKFDLLIPVDRFAENLNKIISHSKTIIHPTAGHHIQEEEYEWVAEQINTFILEKNWH